MGKTYCCPECHGTDVVWDKRTSTAICPNDGTCVSEYQLTD